MPLWQVPCITPYRCGTAAASPTAYTSGCDTERSAASVTTLPCASTARPASAASGAARTPAVHSTASAATPVLQTGSKGSAVTTLQKRLNALGYWCGNPDGTFGAQTKQAVLAVQKVAGLARDGVVGARSWDALNRGVRPSSRRGGNRIEVDKNRQIVMVVRGGSVKYIFNTSTGSGQMFTYYGRRIKAVTPSGEYKTYRSVTSGWDYGSLGGLYRPFYFNGGIALHGSNDIPAYPASHGCCRMSCAAQDFLIGSKLLYIGEAVSVY